MIVSFHTQLVGMTLQKVANDEPPKRNDLLRMIFTFKIIAMVLSELIDNGPEWIKELCIAVKKGEQANTECANLMATAQVSAWMITVEEVVNKICPPGSSSGMKPDHIEELGHIMGRAILAVAKLNENETDQLTTCLFIAHATERVLTLIKTLHTKHAEALIASPPKY